MNRKPFRWQYVLSILLFIGGMTTAVVAVLMTAFDTIMIITQKGDVKALETLVTTAIQGSVLAISGVLLGFIGVLWNVVVSVIRSVRLGSFSLAIVVIVGWVVQFTLPIIGMLLSPILQIWGWFLGSKADTTTFSETTPKN